MTSSKASVTPAADARRAPHDGGVRKRLLYIRDTLTVCGPGKTILNTWRTIDRDRFELTIVATRPPANERSAFLDAARRLGAEPLEMPIGRGLDLFLVWRLIRLIRRDRIDVLQTHDAQTRRAGTVAALLTGTRHVTSVHGWIFNDRKERMAKSLDQWLIRFPDRVITVSHLLKQQLEASGVHADRITVLRNAVVLHDYSCPGSGAALREELGLGDSDSIVSIVGRLSAEKGHDVFLDAAQQILSEFPNTKFLIVGDGPLRQTLQDTVRTRGLATQVVFTGHRSDLGSLYALTDVLVISSLTEGIPNVLLEAFAYGKPAVATAVGGIPEVLEDGRGGWLTRPGDAAGIAHWVRLLLRDPRLRERMGRLARETIERKFSFEARTRALENLY